MPNRVSSPERRGRLRLMRPAKALERPPCRTGSPPQNDAAACAPSDPRDDLYLPAMSQSLAEFPDGWERALVIAAHPDDIEWGAAAAVAAWTAAGKEVVYVLVTSGEAGIDTMDPEGATVTRQAEEHASASIVGVAEVEFLGQPDGRVEENLALRRDLAGAIRRYRPEVVVAQNHDERWGPDPGAGWNSADHRAVGRATIDAVSDAGNRWIFPELAANEPWSGVQWIAIAGHHAAPTRST